MPTGMPRKRRQGGLSAGRAPEAATARPECRACRGAATGRALARRGAKVPPAVRSYVTGPRAAAGTWRRKSPVPGTKPCRVSHPVIQSGSGWLAGTTL